MLRFAQKTYRNLQTLYRTTWFQGSTIGTMMFDRAFVRVCQREADHGERWRIIASGLGAEPSAVSRGRAPLCSLWGRRAKPGMRKQFFVGVSNWVGGIVPRLPSSSFLFPPFPSSPCPLLPSLILLSPPFPLEVVM